MYKYKALSRMFLVAGTSLNYFENGNNITERKEKVNRQKRAYYYTPALKQRAHKIDSVLKRYDKDMT